MSALLLPVCLLSYGLVNITKKFFGSTPCWEFLYNQIAGVVATDRSSGSEQLLFCTAGLFVLERWRILQENLHIVCLWLCLSQVDISNISTTTPYSCNPTFNSPRPANTSNYSIGFFCLLTMIVKNILLGRPFSL